MKKIILAFDGTHYSQAALDFAKSINEKDSVMITGAFLPQVDFASLWSMAGAGASANATLPLMEESTSKEVHDNVHRFETYCRQHHIEFTTHSQYFNFAVPELKIESRFADLLIVSSEEFYKQAGTEASNVYLREILHDLECPLIVIPEKKTFPEANILMYEGTASSVNAIRQFAYLFPELTKCPTTVLHTASNKEAGWPNEQQIRELIQSHFSDVKWELLVLSDRTLLNSWLMTHKNAIVVCGSFGRSELSMLFRKSYVTNAINEHELPVFIAHK